jgi:hypothetical protein
MARDKMQRGQRRGRALSRVEDRRGLALVATLLVLTVMAVLVAAAVKASMTTVRTSGMEYHEARVFYAAEAGAEAALSQLKLALQDGYLSDSELTTIGPPGLDEFSWDSFSVQRLDTAVVEEISDGPYSGLWALTQNVEVYSLASDAGGSTSGIILSAKAQAIPIFQFGVFFEEDLEATNGPPMTFVGRVHSNGNIYLSSANAWYMEMVTTPNKVFHDRKDFHNVLDGVYVFNPATADSVGLDFDSRSIPGAEAFKAESWAKFNAQLRTDAFETDSLRLPLPADVPAVELIRPRETGDTDAERSVKFAWNADTYVTVDLRNPVRYNDGCGINPPPVTPPADAPRITVQRSAGRVVPSAVEMCKMLEWNWSGFYDGREDELKDVLDINVDEIDKWAGHDSTRAIEILYVEFILPTTLDIYGQTTRAAILDYELNPAIRMELGTELPNRMTVATEYPIYVHGDYNSVAKKPAALAGDGITFLSNNWNDDQNRPGKTTVFDECAESILAGDPCVEYEIWVRNWTSRYAAETTINAAILAGHWPTPCDWYDDGCPSDGSDRFYHNWYGGGLENFPRFLERWRTSSGSGRVICRYKGALVSPFTSQRTTGTWSGYYYIPPQREWTFDTDFRDPGKLPPGTPNVGYVLRTAMREAF